MARKKAETFSMSFLDVISCGFGAVVLFYTIMASQAGMTRTNERMNLQAAASRLDREVLEGRRNLADLRNALESTEDKTVQAAGLSRAALERLLKASRSDDTLRARASSASRRTCSSSRRAIAVSRSARRRPPAFRSRSWTISSNWRPCVSRASAC